MKKMRLETFRTKISARLRKIPSRINKLENERNTLLSKLAAIEEMMREKKEPYVKETN